MEVNLVSCLFVLDSVKNENIRKNDIKKIKVLVKKNNSLIEMKCRESGIKNIVRKNLENIIHSNIFHLEQVYTMDYNGSIDIIYLAITNALNVNNLSDDYKLIDFNIENNSSIIFGEKNYSYKTIEVLENNNISYEHVINTKDDDLKRTLMSFLISYKKIRSNVDNTDILFKFMANTFTLEDVRILYEIIKEVKVDKSNFRKKISKYCEKVEDAYIDTKGYRPSSKYKFKPLKGDAWI